MGYMGHKVWGGEFPANWNNSADQLDQWLGANFSKSAAGTDATPASHTP